MKSGGMVGFEKVEWFNGGLFDDDSALPLEAADIDNLLTAARLDWSEIDPSILGTLFERGLDPGKRSQLAHYTDRDKIMMIVRPVIIAPLEREWAKAKAQIETALTKAETVKAVCEPRHWAKPRGSWPNGANGCCVSACSIPPADRAIPLSVALALKDIEHHTGGRAA
jgi:hypothetical protein